MTGAEGLGRFWGRSQQSSFSELLLLLPRVKGVGAVTSTGEGAVLPSSPVVRERETVTVLGTEESMTVTAAVKLVWCAGLTTARSSEPTTTRRTTAVRDLLEVEGRLL